MARHPFSTATQMVTYPIGTISQQLACRRNISGKEVHETLRHQCHGCRRGGAGLVFHDVWERWPSVCSFLRTSARRTVDLGADQSRCEEATRKKLRRDSDGPGNRPPGLGDQRGSEWRTSSPALQQQHHNIITEVSEAIGWGQGSSRAASSPLCSHSLGKPGRAVRKILNRESSE